MLIVCFRVIQAQETPMTWKRKTGKLKHRHRKIITIQQRDGGTSIIKSDSREFIIIYGVVKRVSLFDGSRSSGVFTKDNLRCLRCIIPTKRFFPSLLFLLKRWISTASKLWINLRSCGVRLSYVGVNYKILEFLRFWT